MPVYVAGYPDWVNSSRKTCPLWVAPFPRLYDQRKGAEHSRNSLLSASCLWMCPVWLLQALVAVTFLPYWTLLAKINPFFPKLYLPDYFIIETKEVSKISSTGQRSSLFVPVCQDPQQNPRNRLLAQRELNQFLSKMLLKPFGPLVQSDLIKGLGSSRTSSVRHVAKDHRGKMIQRQFFFCFSKQCYFPAVSKAETPTLTRRETTVLTACS